MQPCPRIVETSSVAPDPKKLTSKWQEDHTCSYCGSLSPEEFFAAIAAGQKIGPTDKNYKVYVTRQNPQAGQPYIVSAANAVQPGSGWVMVTKENQTSLPKGGIKARIGGWVQIAPQPVLRHDKFYFQHLTDEEQLRFVDLLNERKITFGDPGWLYVLPYFVKMEKASV